MKFQELNIIPQIFEVLEEKNYKEATPIQEEAIPAILEGKDIIASSQTGTGKTGAFAIPCLQRLYTSTQKGNEKKRSIRSLVLTPTRELALQVHNNYSTYGKNLGLQNAVIYGGVSQKPQERVLARSVDTLIATPGRLLDLMNQGFVNLSKVEILILDEADRMLDMGFINDVKRIMKAIPEQRQTLLFSATLSKSVIKFASGLLKNPTRISIQAEVQTVDAIHQQFYAVEKGDKSNLFLRFMKEKNIQSALVFTRTKRGADRLAKTIAKGGLRASSIHGDKSQNSRVQALNALKKHQIEVLVATDVAARGIDIDFLPYVFNYDLPEEAESYIHRIGRTGRAGREGIAVSFCEKADHMMVKQIEKILGKKVFVQPSGKSIAI